MSKKLSAAVAAAMMTGALMASTAAYAQTKPIQAPPPPPTEMDPAKRVPPAAATRGQESGTAVPEAATPPPAQRYPASQQYHGAASADASWEAGRGGAFLAAQGGRGWVYDGVGQNALAVSAGYRWQAGPVWLVGVEAAAGRLGSTTDEGRSFAEVKYASIGVNARFNFGRASPVYGLLRAGYFSADEKDFGSADGGYAGLGLGVDVGRHFNMSLVYTNYVYFNELYWEGGDLYYDASRADTLMLGAEVRF